jgi:hypothetical protein
MMQEQVDRLVKSSVGNIPLDRPDTTGRRRKPFHSCASDDSSYVNRIELFVDGEDGARRNTEVHHEPL